MTDKQIPHHWQDHIVFDFEVSKDWPVVKRTRVTAREVAVKLAGGFTVDQIIGSFADDITSDDIYACAGYVLFRTMEGLDQ